MNIIDIYNKKVKIEIGEVDKFLILFKKNYNLLPDSLKNIVAKIEQERQDGIKNS